MEKTPRKEPLQIFLCYAQEDKSEAEKLCKRLQTDDKWEVWFDKKSLLPGQDLMHEIPLAVKRSDIVLVCVSRNLTTKGVWHKEIRIALDEAEKQPFGAIFIIPVCLEPCDLPERLKHLIPVNLFEKYGYDNLLKALQQRSKDLGIGTPDRVVV